MSDEQIQRVLRQHVMTDQLLGVQSVPLGQSDEPVTPSAVQSPAPVAAPARPVARPPMAAAPIAPRPAPPAYSTPARSFSAQAPPAQTAPVPKIDRETKLQVLQEMDQNEVKPCIRCVLCKTRNHTVFGEGDIDARLLFIGEGPGADEDATGRSFVGRAGELLTDMIEKGLKIPRASVYIANVVKCRPPGNRPPTPDESAGCISYLERQIKTLQPAVIVTLGATATKALLKTEQGITAIRGTWHFYSAPTVDGNPIPVMPTFHPAYLLRAYTPENRRKVWEDLKRALARANGEVQ